MALWTSCRFCPSYPATFQISADATGSIVQVQYDISPSPPTPPPQKKKKKKIPTPNDPLTSGTTGRIRQQLPYKITYAWFHCWHMAKPAFIYSFDWSTTGSKALTRTTGLGGWGMGGKWWEKCDGEERIARSRGVGGTWTTMQPPTLDNDATPHPGQPCIPPPRQWCSPQPWTTMQLPTPDNHATPHPGQPCNPHPGQPCHPPPQTTMQPPPWTTMPPPTPDNHATPHPGQPCNHPPQTTMQPPPWKTMQPPPWTTMQSQHQVMYNLPQWKWQFRPDSSDASVWNPFWQCTPFRYNDTQRNGLTDLNCWIKT